MTPLEQLQAWYDASHSAVFFGGAGVSTESGIPDFRSEDGLYRQQYSVPPEVILSHEYYEEHPEEFFRFYREKMLALDKQPNAAHLALARMEAKGKLRGVITQNIDGLHQAAGSKCVCELHGSVHRNFCEACGRRFDAEFIRDSVGIPHCPCGGRVKPDVVLYGESLDSNVLERSLELITQTDLLIVAGTSLTVYPAAGLLQYRQKGKLVLINRDETAYDDAADLVLHTKVGETLRLLQV